MGDKLTLEDLSARIGEPAERLRQWRSLGLIGRGEEEGFAQEDVERARLVQLLLRRGISPDKIAEADREKRFLDYYLEQLFPRGVGPTYSLAEAAETMGLEIDVARRIREASGLSQEGETLAEDDLQALRAAKSVLDAGFPLEALLQVLRVYADTLERAAEAGQRAFHIYVHERLVAAGMSPEELDSAVRAISTQTLPAVEPSILYFFRKGQARAYREDMVLHVAEAVGLLRWSEVPGQLTRAIAFVDLSSFTPLTEAMGDAEAAKVLERFSALVRESAGRWDGRVVKQIGDAFMLVFPDAPSALACALEIEARTAAEPQFPSARSGVHWGDVLYREGDYVGSNVNVAARLASEAERHQVLLTAAVRREAKELPGVEFVPLGKRRLKGLTDALELFEARGGSAAREKAIDPVCGMELGAGEAAARLSLEGPSTGSGERAFCSEECLRRFVAAPERYLP